MDSSPDRPLPGEVIPPYAELQVASNFSFLRGASHPQELALTAASLGLSAFALTDRNTFGGLVRAHKAAQTAGVRFVVGARLDLRCGNSLLAYPTDRAAYGRLSRLLTLGKRRAPKGQCHLDLADVVEHGAGLVLIVLPPQESEPQRHRDTEERKTLLRKTSPSPCGRGKGRGSAPSGAHMSLRRADARQTPPLDPLPQGEGEGALCVSVSLWFESFLHQVRDAFPGRSYLAASHLYRGDDDRRIAALAALAERAGTPLVATNDVHYHEPGRRPLQDVLTCIRERCTIDEAGWRLFPNAERHMKSPAEMARLFAAWPEALARTVEIAERCRFSLDELRYEYPIELTHDGRTPQEELAHLAWQGAQERWPAGVPDKVKKQIEHELALIAQLDYAPYFLTVHDLVAFARREKILCQGRGSAANSAVCYCLGVTAVDPERNDLLFERFISAARNEPPDIDIDFEHERREEVIQYIYGKYGRERAGIAAVVICYRSRSALREVGKAMGLSLDTVGALAGNVWGWSRENPGEDQVRALGFDPTAPRLAQTLALARQLIGFPRHLSQHVGGFVMTRGRLDELVPIENAAMEDRTVIEWDKDDLDDLRILKVDVLALGMLTCIAKCFSLIRQHHGRDLELATVPAEDPATYDMLCRADSVGVFQVESRAQMSMLPRLKPRNFYDLVIEVAIVRPGPIQGDMVHPYLRRRSGEEPVTYPSEALREVLGKTMGVPLFQEQAMRIAIVAAGFTADEADGLRRAMATFKRAGIIHRYRERLIEGMVARGYDRGFAERCYQQLEGFGSYGFPESHAASFALLVYVSAWLKCHYPAAFACALLNSQPMGFYAPAQIVRDARDHGVAVRPVDVNASLWDCTLESAATAPHPDPLPAPRGEGADRTMPTPHPLAPAGGEGRVRGCPPQEGSDQGVALRLGFRQVKGFGESDAARLLAARGHGYPDPMDLWRRAHLDTGALEALARADAFRSMGLDRREALWALRGLPAAPGPLFAAMAAEEQAAEPVPAALPRMHLGEHVTADYKALRLSLKAHPMALLREHMARLGYVPSRRLMRRAANKRVDVAGIVLVRQQPGTASGVIFATLEDETGVANIIIWPKVFARFRRVVLGASLLGVRGTLQREGIVTHVIAETLVDLTPLLRELSRPADAPLPDASEADQGEVDLRIEPSPPDHFKRPPPEKPRAFPDAPVSQPDASRYLPLRDPSFPSRDFR